MATGKIKQLPNENEPGIIQSPYLGEYTFTMKAFDVQVEPDSLKIGLEVQWTLKIFPMQNLACCS